MENDYIIAAIGVGGTLLGTLAGFFSSILYERIKEKSKLESEVRQAIFEIMFIALVNDYPMAMNKLRRLIVKNADQFAANDSVTVFFKKWLNNPALSFDKPIANLYTKGQIEELNSDLAKIKL